MLISFAEQNTCYIEINEDFTGQTLISASEAIIKSTGVSKGDYITAPDILCEIASNLFKYINISISKFQTQSPRAEYIMRIGERNVLTENDFDRTINMTSYKQNLDISMARTSIDLTSVRFIIKIQGMF